MAQSEHSKASQNTRWQRRDWLYGIPLLIGLVLIAYTMRGQPPAPSEATAHVEVPATRPAAVTSTATPGPVGKWRRLDGDYTLEILKIADDGSADVKYYNPRPIHVAKAQLSTTADQVKWVVIVLRDEGYPGNNYTLTLDSSQDRLVGVYRQPVAGQQFEVFFERVPVVN